ncbi:MAG: hypothetical protein AAB368_11895 [bacterium]
MSFQHLTGNQNLEVARFLIAIAKTIGAAAVVTLFFPSAVDQWSPWYWLAALAVTGLLMALGVSMVGRLEDRGGVETARRRPRGRG